jgi:hypothetical protein
MIRIQVFIPLDGFACALSSRKTSTAISEHDCRLENRAGRVHGKREDPL